MMKKSILSSVLIALVSLLVVIPAQAAMVGTAQIQQDQNLLSTDLQSIPQKRDWILKQLVSGGVDKANADLRVAAMTDSQIQQIYQRVDESAAGGASALLIIVLIFVFTELMGYTDVIPGMGPGK
jgi:predicted PurR-regulated permease PerM